MTSLAVELSHLGAAALRYASQGWHVFPLTQREKRPITAHGFLDATADEGQVRSWWSQWRNANIGCAPGRSGFVVVDVDGPDATPPAARLGCLSEPTLECQTGRVDGGRHLYFRHPGGHIPNGILAPKLEIRADAGYVVLPPSVHPSGAVYRWLGKVTELRDCPPALLEAIRRMGTGPVFGERANVSAAEIPTLEEIAEGGRDNTLTRYAGRLLAKGLPVDETYAVVAALNAMRCKPPLADDEVRRLVLSIAGKEDRKRASRTTETGFTLHAVASDEPEPEAPTTASLAAEQTIQAHALLTRDVSRAPTWTWPDLDRLAGPMLPGDLVVVGALMGNGKTTLLLSQMDEWARRGLHVLYMPLELDPPICRLRWAAWRLDLDVKHVIHQNWARLPEGSRESVDTVLDELEGSRVHFVPDKRVTVASLTKWVRWGVEQASAGIVIIDHLHRLDVAVSDSYRVAITEAVRSCKDLSRDAGIPIIAAAQLNRSMDPLDPYLPPSLARIKEASAIAEEADVVLMLSRRLKRGVTKEQHALLRTGMISESELAERGVMLVTCRKHRLDDDARDNAITLAINNNRIRSHAYSHQPTERWQQP